VLRNPQSVLINLGHVVAAFDSMSCRLSSELREGKFADLKMSYLAKPVFCFVVLLVLANQGGRGPERVNAQKATGKERIDANEKKTELFCPADNASNGLQTASQNADLNGIDKNGCTLLMRASENGEAQIVQMLLENGADLEATLPGGVTALILAAKEGQVQVVKLLLRHKANPNAFVFAPHKGVYTALMYAIGSRKMQVIEALIEAGADVNPPDMIGMTPLSLAIYETQDLTIVKALLVKGADVNLRTHYGLTALMAAAENENIDFVKTLLAAGANVNERSDDGTTALMNAAEARSPEVVRALIAAGAYLHATNKYGETAFSLALRAGRKDNLAVLRQASHK